MARGGGNSRAGAGAATHSMGNSHRSNSMAVSSQNTAEELLLEGGSSRFIPNSFSSDSQ